MEHMTDRVKGLEKEKKKTCISMAQTYYKYKTLQEHTVVTKMFQ